MSIPQIFIVGVGRSGTTLLQSMLAAHQNVVFLPETVFIRRFIATGALDNAWRRQGKDLLRETLLKDRYLKRLDVDLEETLDSVNTSTDQVLDYTIYQNLVHQYLASDTPAFIGDKDPKLVEYLPLLHHFFPDCRIIHVIRDPRDVLESKKRAEWSRDRSILTHVFAGKVQFHIGRKYGQALFGDRYFEIIYEQLINQPEHELIRLCTWLGLEYDPGMLSFGDAAKKLVADDEMSWKKETLGPLLTTNIGKWQTGLTPREIRLTQKCCNEAMQAGNYKHDTSSTRLGVLNRIWLLAGRAVISLATLPYMLYRNFKVTKACKKKS